MSHTISRTCLLNPNRIVAANVYGINRIVVTVRKHIVPQEALAGAGVAVGVEEAAQGRVVVAALQVVEARLFGGEIAMRSKNKAHKLQKRGKEDRRR